MKWLIANGMKLIRITAGLAVLLVGIGLLVLPGPGIPLILVGLTILAVDFVWARRLKTKIHDTARNAYDKVRGKKPDA
jgi:tellurite resistance protein TerC